MSRIVVDCSVTMAWCFENQSDEFTRRVLSGLNENEAYVPSIWPYEVANSLVVAERRKKLSRSGTTGFVTILSGLPIEIEEDSHGRALAAILDMARDQHLSAYDAAYLELALRRGFALATRDESLKRAARSLGVKLFRS